MKEKEEGEERNENICLQRTNRQSSREQILNSKTEATLILCGSSGEWANTQQNCRSYWKSYTIINKYRLTENTEQNCRSYWKSYTIINKYKLRENTQKNCQSYWKSYTIINKYKLTEKTEQNCRSYWQSLHNDWLM